MPSTNNLPLLLTDNLPLRRASDLPKYRAEAASRYLPWVFGRATVSPVPLDAEGLEWLVADHPIVAVDKVTVAGKETSGWQLQQRLDETGQGVSVIRLAQPTTKDPVVVSLAGRKHPTTGALLENPREIVREIMRLCKHIESPDAWVGLDHYRLVDLAFVFAAKQTLRASIASVIQPLSAIWRPQWAEPKTPGVAVLTLDVTNTETISARIDNTTLGTLARVSYAYDWAAGAARGTMLLGAPDARERWGDLVRDVDLPSVRRARDALALATAHLADSARATWTIQATVDARVGNLLAGQTIALDHPLSPKGFAIITSVTKEREQPGIQLKAVMYTETVPKIEMLRINAAVDSAVAADPTIVYKDGMLTYIVLDEQGDPMANATVTLDGIDTATTNASGQVQFRTTRGAHTLTVSAVGYAAFEMDVVV